MRRAITRVFISIAIAIALSLGRGAATSRADDRALPPASIVHAEPKAIADNDNDFARMAQQFIDEDLRLYPEEATELGEHRYDDRLTGMSRAVIDQQIQHAAKWKRDFTQIPSDHLSPAHEADREWLIAQADAMPSWNPGDEFEGARRKALAAVSR